MPFGKAVKTNKTIPPKAYCEALLYLASCFMIPPIIPPIPRGLMRIIITHVER